ncbi:MAG: DNA-directed RNA polymerase specialized sigma subunit, sigma24 family [Chloroflexi bacterium AL-W]|nr:DNA-directed RNA polymerase specialized sigma subunit, sigma24 family [Chloroflexi bacterium AL-N1]NOK66011.1 DNA-directed RNA polymerase specialized sigma subunit, sigma24 family [Chloroflexi bacterium AL-N10]NOK72892.1 DNA-directed RNA polymerase specialized sigma subunit, sigma24 family [Chloroflexi bacterium AL-N5]NOK79789.1 DNA-directed RNA polymerase specialized sigma subunit, sigma24 family [Chloroflexi bacterium AL-W]NOK88355.1 DNA-directed RNA polymerase specialized sigma subunit, s
MVHEEQRLITAAQRGNVDDFNALVRMYETRVYTLCYRMLGDGDSAADAAQDAFISAFRNIKRFRGGSFRSWMLRIATNTCYDVLRARKRRPTTSLDIDEDEEDVGSPLQIADPSESPDDTVMRHELASAIQDGLEKLPEDQRIVLILSDVQGFAYEEIAEVTDTNLGTVKSRLSRARSRLRTILKGEELLPVRYRHDSDR